MTRLVMFGILFRYFTKRYLAWVLLCLVGLTAVVSLIDTVELIRRVSVLKTGIDVNFGLMTLLNIPNVMSVVLPFALLSCSMLCFNEWNKSNEFVIARGMGISIWVAMSPVFFAAFACGLFYILVINPIGSLTSRQYESNMSEIFGSDERNLSVTAEGVWLRDSQPDRQLILHGDALDTVNAGVINPIIYEFIPPRGLVTRYRGSFVHLTDSGWIIENAVAWRNDGGNENVGTFMLASNVKSLDLERSTAPPETIPIYQLPNFIKVLETTGLPTTDHKIYLYQLLSLPFLMVGIAMLGARFTLSNTNRQRRVQLFTRGVLIATAIFSFGHFMQVLGGSFRLPPNVAGWAPAATILLTGAALLARLDES